MKAYKYIVALLAGLAVISCNKDFKEELPAPQDGNGLITIKATMPDGVFTKAGASVGFSWNWSAGDKLTVIGEEGSEVYTIKEGFSGKFAEFVGKPVKGTKFSIMYPNDKASSTEWSSQTQAANNTYDHLKYAAALNDVDDYTSFSFSPAWAAEHGGTLQQIGVLKMVIALPDTVTAVNGVSVAAEDAVFFKGNGDSKVKKLELAVDNAAPDANHTFTAWMVTSWNEASIPAGTTLAVSVKTKGAAIEKEVTFSKEAVMMSGKVNVFNVDGSGWALPSHYASGKGTEDKPWVIMTPEQLMYMNDDLVAGECRYFKLGANINMNGFEWTQLNPKSPFDKQIDFNGAGFTISNLKCSNTDLDYTSFFGVLFGKCYDVKFVNATVTTAKKGAGILGGYGGTGGKPCEVRNVQVQGTITSSAGNSVGGLFGTARECTITACSADVTITTNGQQVGGLIGADSGLGVTITDCWTAGSIVSSASICGGICGDLTAKGSSIYNCYSTMSVTTQYLFGGIVGRAVAGQKSNASNCNNQDPQNHIEKCIAWNPSLTSNNADTSEHYSSGTVIGATAVKNYLVGCIRKPDIAFTDCPGNAALGTNYTPWDQEDASPESPMAKGPGTYAFAYHGKAAAAGKTLTQVAKELGWSSTVWDFSSSEPKLK